MIKLRVILGLLLTSAPPLSQMWKSGDLSCRILPEVPNVWETVSWITTITGVISYLSKVVGLLFFSDWFLWIQMPFQPCGIGQQLFFHLFGLDETILCQDDRLHLKYDYFTIMSKNHTQGYVLVVIKFFYKLFCLLWLFLVFMNVFIFFTHTLKILETLRDVVTSSNKGVSLRERCLYKKTITSPWCFNYVLK